MPGIFFFSLFQLFRLRSQRVARWRENKAFQEGVLWGFIPAGFTLLPYAGQAFSEGSAAEGVDLVAASEAASAA